MKRTLEQYQTVVHRCRDLFEKKTRDYGTAWRILRPSSLTDQIYIKAQRIRSIEEKGEQKVSDPVGEEYIGIVNYSLMALIQLKAKPDLPRQLTTEQALQLYDQQVEHTRSLMQRKNHDYGEAWRLMRISSITDMILQKLLRIKQIEDNQGETLISEGLPANYQDIINYAIFALILMDEQKAEIL